MDVETGTIQDADADVGADAAALAALLADPRRRVALETVHNLRDLGGYPTVDGRVTRWGVLYRSDGFHRMTAADVAVVRSLGLRTVVDLRTFAEIEERGRFPDEITVDFVHHPILDRTSDGSEVLAAQTDHEFLVGAYTQMLAEGATNFGRAITDLARPGALPAVFHCAAGKDRTGILAALLLGSLGVPRHVLLGDYGLTREAMVRMRAWALREFPEMADRISDTPSVFFAAVPEALGDVLDTLVDEHGTLRDYVLSVGVTSQALDSLAASLLQPQA